jgi:FkbM family methyltransferase
MRYWCYPPLLYILHIQYQKMKPIHSEPVNNINNMCVDVKCTKTFYYGTPQNFLNVTDIVMNDLLSNDVIHIPSGDLSRTYYFTDPVYGVHKSFKIVDRRLPAVDQRLSTVESINEKNIEMIFDHTKNVYIDLITNDIYTDENVPDRVKMLCDRSMEYSAENNTKSKQKLYHRLKTDVHSKLKLNFGSFNDELPEQLLSLKYLTGDEKVLEFGGNIGRNSLVIAHVLSKRLDKNSNKNSQNSQNSQNFIDFVTLECDPRSAEKLKINRDLNSFNFHIETSALSKRNLLQRGWNTIASDVPVAGYEKVNTITLEELNRKYNIHFDTLVIDCEGAFYHILVDMPEILDTIKLIIVENDYRNKNHKIYVDGVFKKNGFRLVYIESGGWGHFYNNFYEVWKKK